MYSNLTLHFPHLKDKKNERRQVRAELGQGPQGMRDCFFRIVKQQEYNTLVAAQLVHMYLRNLVSFKKNASSKNFLRVGFKVVILLIMKKEKIATML
jgi:hypothetical protein